MTDKQLLDFAAKACGFIGTVTEYPNGYVEMGLSNHFKPDGSNVWNPLTNDGDALRLALKLNMTVAGAIARTDDGECTEFDLWKTDHYAATRRAIVRAGASIGKTHEI